MGKNKTKVLIVDDSKTFQSITMEMLSLDKSIEVISHVTDPTLALQKVIEKRPDVVLLDIVMPNMCGIEVLEELMKINPLPVVMYSILTQDNTQKAFECLNLGAIDYLEKPTELSSFDLVMHAKKLIKKLKIAACVDISHYVEIYKKNKKFGNAKLPEKNSFVTKLVVIGASTGGVEAIQELLSGLPVIFPPIIVALHMPKLFTLTLAQRLDKSCSISVVEQNESCEVQLSTAYIVAGGKHADVSFIDNKIQYKPFNPNQDDVLVPSIDILFNSVADTIGESAIGIILSGMGDDGAAGLKAMKNAGAQTIAQDQESSLIWGMPGAAVKIDAVDHILSIKQIANKLNQIIEVI